MDVTTIEGYKAWVAQSKENLEDYDRRCFEAGKEFDALKALKAMLYRDHNKTNSKLRQKLGLDETKEVN